MPKSGTKWHEMRIKFKICIQRYLYKLKNQICSHNFWFKPGSLIYFSTKQEELSITATLTVGFNLFDTYFLKPTFSIPTGFDYSNPDVESRN